MPNSADRTQAQQRSGLRLVDHASRSVSLRRSCKKTATGVAPCASMPRPSRIAHFRLSCAPWVAHLGGLPPGMSTRPGNRPSRLARGTAARVTPFSAAASPVVNSSMALRYTFAIVPSTARSTGPRRTRPDRQHLLRHAREPRPQRLSRVDAFVEVAIWRVGEPAAPSTHEFRYRLAYVVGNRCVLRYDNERGKGDHRHIENGEAPYAFSTPDQLFSDSEAEIARWNREHGRS